MLDQLIVDAPCISVKSKSEITGWASLWIGPPSHASLVEYLLVDRTV